MAISLQIFSSIFIFSQFLSKKIVHLFIDNQRFTPEKLYRCAKSVQFLHPPAFSKGYVYPHLFFVLYFINAPSEGYLFVAKNIQIPDLPHMGLSFSRIGQPHTRHHSYYIPIYYKQTAPLGHQSLLKNTCGHTVAMGLTVFCQQSVDYAAVLVRARWRRCARFMPWFLSMGLGFCNPAAGFAVSCTRYAANLFFRYCSAAA